MPPRLLSCLPGINWIPSDIPDHAPRIQIFPRSGGGRIRSHLSLTKHPLNPHSSSQIPYLTAERSRKAISLTSLPNNNFNGPTGCLDDVCARTDPQDKSLFLTRLPLELRCMVYEYVFGGGEVIHLTLGGRDRLGHFVCEESELGREMGLGWECGCTVLVGGRDSKKLQCASAMGILTVCRRVYSEAIPYLYRPHTFSLLHSTHLLFLPRHFPTRRLHSIRSLRLRWHIRGLPYYVRYSVSLEKDRHGILRPVRLEPKYAYRDETENWDRAWRIIAEMQGLQELHVELLDNNGLWRPHWAGVQKDILAPVKLVMMPRLFELVLPYADADINMDMGGSCCVLKKPYGPARDGEED